MPPRAYDPYRDHEHVNAFPIQTRGMITAASACCEIRNGILSEDSRNNGGAGLGGAQNGHRNFFMCCAGTVRVRVRYGTAINGRYASYGSQGVWVANKDCNVMLFWYDKLPERLSHRDYSNKEGGGDAEKVP
jgi:hypothetical protein